MTEVDTARGSEQERAEIEMTVPADSAYLSVLRTAAAGLAARLDFTLDDIEDLRIAVDEACSLLLSQAVPDSRLACSFRLSPDAVTFRAQVRSADPKLPSRDGFAWTVLTALASTVEFELVEPDQLVIELARRRPGVDPE